MGLTEALVLGLFQGMTEFLPVSSSAHLVFLPWLFGWQDPGLTFDVGLHVGTFVAVVAYFWRDWIGIFRGMGGGLTRSPWLGGMGQPRSAGQPPRAAPTSGAKPGRRVGAAPAPASPGQAGMAYREPGGAPGQRRGVGSSGGGAPAEGAEPGRGSLGWLLVLGTIPGVVVGVLFEHQAETVFRDIRLVAVMLMLLGLVLLLAERLAKHVRGLDRISLWDSLLIGVAQAFAIIPGVSRSGSTISMGLFRGLEREAAARFSFLLGTPIILGASAKRLPSMFTMPPDDRLPFVLGSASSAIAGFATIALLLRYLQRHSTVPFVVYRLVLGIALLGLAFWRGA